MSLLVSIARVSKAKFRTLHRRHAPKSEVAHRHEEPANVPAAPCVLTRLVAVFVTRQVEVFVDGRVEVFVDGRVEVFIDGGGYIPAGT
jgi:hypothetical protein